MLTGSIGVMAATSNTNTFCYDNFSNYRSFTDCIRSKYLNKSGPLNTPDKKTEPKQEEPKNDPTPLSKTSPYYAPKIEPIPAKKQEKKEEAQSPSTKYIAEANLAIPGKDLVIVAKCPSTSSCELYENGKFTKNYNVKFENNELIFNLPYRVHINYKENTKKFELDKGWHPDQKTYFNQPDNSSKISVLGRCSDFKEHAIISLKTFLTNKSCMGAQQRQLLGYAQYKVKLNSNGKQSVRLVYSYTTWFDVWH
jgi:hypothetical protein